MKDRFRTGAASALTSQSLLTLRVLMVLTLLILSGCAGWSLTPAPTASAASPRQTAVACPAAEARFHTCGSGVRLLTYQADYTLELFCAPVAELEQRLPARREATRVVHLLPKGERVVQTGMAGWLVLPPEVGILETPAAAAAWWNNRDCNLPTALTQ